MSKCCSILSGKNSGEDGMCLCRTGTRNRSLQCADFTLIVECSLIDFHKVLLLLLGLKLHVNCSIAYTFPKLLKPVI